MATGFSRECKLMCVPSGWFRAGVILRRAATPPHVCATAHRRARQQNDRRVGHGRRGHQLKKTILPCSPCCLQMGCCYSRPSALADADPLSRDELLSAIRELLSLYSFKTGFNFFGDREACKLRTEDGKYINEYLMCVRACVRACVGHASPSVGSNASTATPSRIRASSCACTSTRAKITPSRFTTQAL